MPNLVLALTTKFREIKHSLRGLKQKPDVFSSIHDENGWKSDASVSGPGSELGETEDIRALLPDLFGRLGVKSFLDIPCGDFHWMQNVDLSAIRYIGADVVPHLVKETAEKFGAPNKTFIQLDLIRDDLPRVDLILCRDCLIHLSFKDARRALNNLKRSGSRYGLITTNPTIRTNYPINTGEFRPVNLELLPFSLGKPIELHRDRRKPLPGETLIDPDKSLALYRLN
jgi:hypothetical protein